MGWGGDAHPGTPNCTVDDTLPVIFKSDKSYLIVINNPNLSFCYGKT